MPIIPFLLYPQKIDLRYQYYLHGLYPLLLNPALAILNCSLNDLYIHCKAFQGATAKLIGTNKRNISFNYL